MKFYPINLDIRGKKIVIIGGGSVAYQKVVGLLEGGAQITLIASHLSSEISELEKNKKIFVIQKKYEKGDLKGALLVFGATNNPEVNQQIHEEARKRNILFNAVDQPEECDFIIPSRISRGDLLVTLSTAGTAPFLSKAFRKKLELMFGLEYAEFVQLFGDLREVLTKKRRKEELIPFFERFGEEILTAFQKNNFLLIKEILEKEFEGEIVDKVGRFFSLQK